MFYYLFLFVFIFNIQSISAQIIPEKDIDLAYQNAKKGIYWALENVPEKKLRLKNDLIYKNKLYASVSLVKEINGMKITSRGYNNSTEVTIKIYKSLEKEIDKTSLPIKKDKKELQAKDNSGIKKDSSIINK